MRQYRDLFGKKLHKKDVTQAVIYTVRGRNAGVFYLSRSLHIGLFKARSLVQLLADAGVTSPMNHENRRVLLKEDAALNAAFRQLKKGNK